jgi:hypothetical protein
MDNPDFFDFMIEGGDELLNSEVCPKCVGVIYLVKIGTATIFQQNMGSWFLGPGLDNRN